MKILLCSEFSYLSTGYATYYRELAKGLVSCGHEVVELASYGDNNNKDHVNYAQNAKWTIYLNVPLKEDEEGMKNFKLREQSSKDAKFGSWLFDQIVIDEKPDIVIGLRDFWYDKFIHESPMSDYYISILSPTVDARPQKGEWLSGFSQCDIITTYNEWSMNWLKEQYHSKNLVSYISPSVKDEFVLKDKESCRLKMGIDPSIKLVGTVMRNQRRKRFPELFDALSKTKDIYLYAHTTYPDRGWDIPALLNSYGVLDRVFFTYVCESCESVRAQLFSGAKCACNKCGGKMGVVTVKDGISEDCLSDIYNCLDLYIQPHNSEGFGIPVIEAAACGVKIAATNYSAQEDIIEKLGGIKIEPQYLEVEIESNCKRAQNSVDNILEVLINENNYIYDREEVADIARREYNWEKTVQSWNSLISSCKPKNRWDYPRKNIKAIEFDKIKHLDNATFVTQCILFVAQRPKLLGSYIHHECLHHLNTGIYSPKDQDGVSKKGMMAKITKEDVYKRFLGYGQLTNSLEEARVST